MAIELVVVQPFAGYARGDVITDADQVAEFSESHPHHVVRREALSAAQPTPEKEG